ncbi:RGS domain-containing protein [Plasmodiophora brassicae]
MLHDVANAIATVMLVLDGIIVLPSVVAYLRRRHRQQIRARLPILTVVIILALQVKVTHDLLMVATDNRYLNCDAKAVMIVLTFVATATFNLRAALLYWSYRVTRSRMILAAVPLQPSSPDDTSSDYNAEMAIVPVVATDPSPACADARPEHDAPDGRGASPGKSASQKPLFHKPMGSMPVLKTQHSLSGSDQWYLTHPGVTSTPSIVRIMAVSVAVHVLVLLGSFVDVARYPQTAADRCAESAPYTIFMFLWTAVLLAQQFYYVVRIRVVVDVFQIRKELMLVWYSSTALLVAYLVPPLLVINDTVFPVLPLAYWAMHKFQVAVQLIQPVYRSSENVDDDEFIRQQGRPPITRVIETDEGAAALTAFMATEFAVESPLFLIAVRDFQRLFPRRLKVRRPSPSSGRSSAGSWGSCGGQLSSFVLNSSTAAETNMMQAPDQESTGWVRQQVPAAATDAALAIYHAFIKQGAPLQVNISSDAHNAVLAAIREPGGNINKYMFDLAVNDVVSLFKGGPVTRFWTSEHGRRLLALG